MEVYILDALLRREVVVDKFVSLIWSERWKEIGDFELLLHSTTTNRGRFITGKRLATNESYYVMTVETVEDTTDSEGRRLLKVKGRSLEAILEDRSAMDPTNFITGEVNWHLTGLPKAIAQEMFTDICVTGTLDANDIIPFLGSGALFPADNIPAPDDAIDWYQPPAQLYDAIKEICDIYEMGFRLVRNPYTNLLRFDIYTGSDRTLSQSILPAVIFSPELENLQNTTELSTISQTKNAVYIITEVAGSYYYQLVFDENVDPDVEGFERHILTMTVTLDEEEITTIPASIYTALQRRGKDELTKHRAFTAFDGEISQRSQYKYLTHYFLGDLVGMQNSEGNVNNMRVTEQIFVSDAEGDRSYPTLAINNFVEPGSWAAMGFRVWEDMGLTEYWETMP